jgi:glycosyltransferase involved in cell wall biosynthesis
MRIWLPYVETGTGTDVFTKTLADSLSQRGHDAQITAFSHWWQYAPWRLRLVRIPDDTQVVVANSWNAFAFKREGIPLVSVEHLLVLDPALAPYRSFPQAVFHNTFVRYFERRSAAASEITVAVSEYTAGQLRRHVAITPKVIPNGVDTRFFRPDDTLPSADERDLVLLFVGTISKRKGADLLAPIMKSLGPGYQLRITGEQDDAADLVGIPGVTLVGSLDRTRLRIAYRESDLLLFPSRLEGLPLVVLEAMACGTPVVASKASSIGEIVSDGVTGRLCPVDDVESFVAAIRELRENPERLAEMAVAARRTVETGFSIDRMTDDYLSLFERLTLPGGRIA